MGRFGAIRPLSEARLRGLTTPRLLAYQRRLYRLHEGPSFTADSEWHESWLKRDGYIVCKSDPAYERLRTLVRSILADREHVER
jgi:hypothetical protein